MVEGLGASADMELKIGTELFRVHESLLETPYPSSLSLESTNCCNLACSHCGHSQFSSFAKGHFNVDYLQKIGHLLGSEIRGVSLSNFGEPFMSKVWDTLLHRVLSSDSLSVFFITNGLLLDGHIREVLHPRLSMAISIDGASEETYGYFRGKGRFSRLMGNLTLLKEQKARQGIAYPEITFLFTVSQVNCSDLPRIVELAAQMGAAAVIVQLQVFFDHGRFERESLFFAQEEYDRAIKLARQRAAMLGIGLIHPDSFDGEAVVPREAVSNSWLGRDADGLIRCYAQSTTCYVKYDGAIEACCAPDHNVMGSLALDSFEDIWHGPLYRDLRLSLERGAWPKRCRCCNLIQAVDVHDERAHLVEMPSGGFISHPPAKQPYRVTEKDATYRQALSSLPGNPRRALALLAPLLPVDPNLYEVHNLHACLLGLRGDYRAMKKGLEGCMSVAPRDPLIAENYGKALPMPEKRGLKRFLPW